MPDCSKRETRNPPFITLRSEAQNGITSGRLRALRDGYEQSADSLSMEPWMLPSCFRRLASSPDLPLMLTVAEAAEALRISRTTAYKLVELNRSSSGRAGLPHVRLGGRVLVGRVDITAITGVPLDAA